MWYTVCGVGEDSGKMKRKKKKVPKGRIWKPFGFFGKRKKPIRIRIMIRIMTWIWIRIRSMEKENPKGKGVILGLLRKSSAVAPPTPSLRTLREKRTKCGIRNEEGGGMRLNYSPTS